MCPANLGAASSDFPWEGLFLAVGALLLVLLAWFVIGYLIFFVANLASGVKAWATKQQLERNALARQAPVHGFPVVAEGGAPVDAGESGRGGPLPVGAIGSGPGRYRIVGVVAATGTDIQMYVDAATPANAKVKAELKGVVVTEVEKQ